MHRLLPAILLLICAESVASNLVPNSAFDTDISGWIFSGSCFVPVWDSFDNPSNGALAVNCFPASSPETVSQCVAVPHTDLDFSAQITDNGNASPVSFGLVVYSNADCTGSAMTLLDPATAYVVPGGGCCGRIWTPISRADISVPAGIPSVQIEIMVASPADIALDDIRLGPSLFQDGFDASP